ncbi:MAG: futalosine hydrolase [Planctomycetaceae bacterium]
MLVDLLVCVATELEGAELHAMLEGGRVARGSLVGRDVALLRTGVGPVNAAHAVTLFLAGERAGAVVVCGVGGAYPGSGLAVGEVACAESEIYGDLGAESPTGFLDMEALGFPLVDGPEPLYNRLPMQLFPAARCVPFVTVSTCSGTDERARALQARTGGGVESMEGAAVAHIARMHGLPVGELRGISNLVGTRDRAGWKLREAAEAAQRALLSWLERP